MVPHFMEHTRARSLFFFWGPRDQPWSAVGEWVCATAVSKSFPPHNSHHQVSHLPLLPYSPPLHTPNRIRMQRVRLSQPNSLAAKTARCVVIVAQKHSKRKMPAQKKNKGKAITQARWIATRSISLSLQKRGSIKTSVATQQFIVPHIHHAIF